MPRHFSQACWEQRKLFGHAACTRRSVAVEERHELVFDRERDVGLAIINAKYLSTGMIQGDDQIEFVGFG